MHYKSPVYQTNKQNIISYFLYTEPHIKKNKKQNIFIYKLLKRIETMLTYGLHSHIQSAFKRDGRHVPHVTTMSSLVIEGL